MELFSISCTTCKTRLKVRDEGAIGKLLDCPKCGAFVLIEAPPGWKAGQASGNGARASDSAVAIPISGGLAAHPSPPPPPAETTFDDAASLLSDAPTVREATFAATAPSAPVTALPPEPKSNATEIAAGLATAAAVPSPDIAGATQVSEEVEAPPYEASLESAEVAAELAPPAGGGLPQWLLMGVAAVGGVALALGLFVVAVWLFSGGERTPVVAVGQGDTNPPDAVMPRERPEPAVDPKAAKSAKPIEGAKAEQPDPHLEKPMSAADPIAVKPGTTPKEPADPGDTVKAEGPGKKSDPPKDGAPADPKLSEPVDPKTVSGAIDKFSRFLDDPASSTTDVPVEVPGDKPAVAETDVPVPAEESVPPRPEPRKVDVAARLGDKLAQVEFQAVPLADFAQFITDFSTIPVTLDPEALQFARATPDKPVSIKLRDASIGAVFTDALAPLGLAYEITSAGLMVGRPAPADGKLRASPYTVTDLGGDDAERLAALAELAAALVAPESWESASGPGTLVPSVEKQALLVQQSEAVHFQIVLFCEKLRVARGLSPRSKFDKSLFQLEPRVARAASKLNTPITLNFSQPAPLVRILDRLGKTAGLRILVDWQAAATVGWSPEAEGTVVADKLPLGDTLSALLRPMDLTYRVVDENLLQVTTPRALEARLELEFYPVSDLLSDKQSGQQLLERVKASLGDELFPEAGPGGAIRFDAPAKCLLVSLPQLKQAELVKLLAEWRAEK